MTIKKLFNILQLVTYVESNKWNDVTRIVSGIAGGEITIKEKLWCNYKANLYELYPLDLSKIETWSTFEGDCIHLRFYMKQNALVCYVHIYEGDSFSGHMRNIRFTATLILPNSFIKVIEPKIVRALNYFAEEEYHRYLDKQKKDWITNFKSQLIK